VDLEDDHAAAAIGVVAVLVLSEFEIAASDAVLSDVRCGPRSI
jgi:hypothetical protein